MWYKSKSAVRRKANGGKRQLQRRIERRKRQWVHLHGDGQLCAAENHDLRAAREQLLRALLYRFYSKAL